jgi:hypothetical protein
MEMKSRLKNKLHADLKGMGVLMKRIDKKKQNLIF